MQMDHNIPACIGMPRVIPGLADFNFRLIPFDGNTAEDHNINPKIMDENDNNENIFITK